MSDWKECPKCHCMNLRREACQDCGRDLKDVAPEQPKASAIAEAKGGSQQQLVGLLVAGLVAAEGAQVLADCYFERDGRDGYNNDNYCRLLDWIKDARRALGKPRYGLLVHSEIESVLSPAGDVALFKRGLPYRPVFFYALFATNGTNARRKMISRVSWGLVQKQSNRT